MEKFFLGALFLSEELDIINQQYVHVAEFIAEADHLVVTQRIDHLISEFFTRDVADRSLRLPPLYLMSNGLHQVGLSHAHAAIQKEWVVGLRGPLCHSL